MARNEKKTIVGLLDNRYDEGQKQKQAFIRQWYINIAYLVGYQWIYWNTVTRRLEQRYTPHNKIRMVSNQILPIFATALAKLTKNPPKFQTGASTKDPEDIVSAAASRKIVNHYWRHLDLEDEADLFTAWLVTTGNAFLMCEWDRTAGRKVRLPLTWDEEIANDPKASGLINPATMQPYQPGQPIINPETGQPFVYEGNEGDPDIHVISPFMVYIPKGTKRFEKAPWMLTGEEMNRDQIASIFGNKIAGKINYEIKEKDSPVERSIFTRLQGLFGGTPGESDEDTKAKEKTVTVLKSWDAPIGGEEKGAHFITAGGEVLYKGAFDYEGLGYPIKHCYYHRIPGLAWGRGLIEDEIPLQKQYNKRLSQIVEAINEISRPKILLPVGCQVSPLSFTKNAGEKIYYNPLAGEPKYLQTGDLPQSLFADLENLRKDMQQVAGLHEVSHADVPASVRSGVAISFLQDTDDTRLGKITRRIENTWAKSGKHLLYTVQRNVQEPRIGKWLGDDQEIEVFEFKGADIRDSVDVFVQAGSAFPQNQMLKQQFVKELYDSGLIPPDQAVRLLEIEGAHELRKGTLLDMRVAKIENDAMAKSGQPVPPDLFEDIQVHLEIHGDWLKANKFSQDPNYMAVYQHYQQTFMLMQQMMAPMMAQEQGQEQGGGQAGGQQGAV